VKIAIRKGRVFQFGQDENLREGGRGNGSFPVRGDRPEGGQEGGSPIERTSSEVEREQGTNPALPSENRDPKGSRFSIWAG